MIQVSVDHPQFGWLRTVLPEDMMAEACLELGLDVTLGVALGSGWVQRGPSKQAPFHARSHKGEAAGCKTEACGGTKRKVDSTPAGIRSLDASRLTRQTLARCRGDRVPALLFEELKSSQVHWAAGQTVMKPCRTQHHGKNVFCSFRLGAKHHVFDTSDATRLPRFPKRLVHALVI